MNVYGVPISDEQLAAGIAVMAGSFRSNEVKGALLRAGVPPEAQYRGRSHPYVADEAANRLLQRERKAGRIRAVNNKLWEKVS